jgi:hypothetical protein
VCSPVLVRLVENVGGIKELVDCVFDKDRSVLDPTDFNVRSVFIVDEEGACKDITGTDDAGLELLSFVP